VKYLIRIAFFTLCLIFTYQTSYAQTFSLIGNAQLIMENGQEQPAKNISSINLLRNNKSLIKYSVTEVDPEGFFTITLDTDVINRGDKLKLKIECDGWSVYAPYKGEFNIPSDFKEIINIKLIANKSQVNVGQYTATFVSTDVYVVEGVNNFYVQVFATGNFDKALEVRDTLSEMGFYNATVVDSHYRNKEKGLDNYYKIYLGPYINEEVAKDVMIKVRENKKKPNIFHDSFMVPWVK
jgi:hypothetical protein